MNISKSEFFKENNILTVKIGSDFTEHSTDEIGHASVLPATLIIIAIDNSNENAIKLATQFIEKVKSDNTCVICICKDLTEDDECGNKIGHPIEIQLEALKSISNTLIIAQDKHTYQEVIDMVLFFYEEVPDMQAELLSHKFENGGFAYYNSLYKQNAWNSESFIDFAIFDSLFTCPLYMAKEVFFSLECGNEFVMTKDNNIGDQGIIMSYLEDYLNPKVLLNSGVTQNEDMPPFAINARFLFCQFGDECFVFDENGSLQYPQAADKHLMKRIDRMLQLPFHNKNKRKKYEEEFDK